jgi:hypothetical protein
VQSEHSDQEECDHVSTSASDSDGAASDDNDAASETDGDYETKNGIIWNKLPPLVSRRRKHSTVIGKLGLTIIVKIFQV